jgi:peptidoglycan hydrolase-like protein with peptidoglycan-binding domain
LAVLIAAVLAGAAGMWIGSQIESPADRAAARGAPTPSLVTVPVERRQLTSEVVLSGEVAYNEPLSVTLAGAVGLDPGETAVVTELREVGTDVQEGDVLLEVTTRPVFVLKGELPMYRRLVIGTEGPDVAQLEQAMVRLGYDPGTVDTVFDASTAAAVEQMYADAGYAAEGPSDEQRTEMTTARDAVTAAERSLADARKALDDAQKPRPESERLQLEQSVDDARRAVAAARESAQAARVEQDQLVASARAARDTAQTVRDAAATVRDAAHAAGAIDPDTGEPYTPERIAALDVAAAEAQQAYTEAEAQLVIAEQARTPAINTADAAVVAADAQRRIAEAQLAEGTADPDNGPLQEAVTTAEAALSTAQSELAELEASAGVRISPGEVVFAPVLPANLTEAYLALGSAVDGPVGMLTTSETLVRARVARADAGLVAVGSEVEVEIRDAGVTLTGTVLSVGEPPQQASTGEQPGGGTPGGSDSGRMEVVVAPAPDVDIGQYMFYGARVRVPIDATDGEVLVVPVAALTVGPDEVSQVEVERVAATDERPAETEIVPVNVGLTAGGLAEVAPIEAGALQEGDRVVIGVDSHLLPGNAGEDDANNDDEGSPDENADDEAPPVSGESDDGDDDDDADGDDDGDDDAAVSPLGELLGWVSDPVEQRRQQLEIEEQVAECMKAEGWEYTPVDWEAQMPEVDVDMSDPQAFGEKYGYGVMYNYETNELGGDGGPMGIPFEDPNGEYMMSLSPSDQEAYSADLYGDPGIWEQSEDGATDATMVVAPPLDQQGCQGKARLEVVGEDPSSDPAVQQILNDFYESQQNDPGLQAIVDTWSECLQPKLDEYGLEADLTNVFDGYQIMEAEKYKALGAEVVPVASQAEMDEYFTSGENVLTAYTDENGSGYIVLAPDGELPELTADQIDELTAMELDVWAADQACQEEAGYADYNQQREQDLVDQLVSEFPELGN